MLGDDRLGWSSRWRVKVLGCNCGKPGDVARAQLQAREVLQRLRSGNCRLKMPRLVSLCTDVQQAAEGTFVMSLTRVLTTTGSGTDRSGGTRCLLKADVTFCLLPFQRMPQAQLLSLVVRKVLRISCGLEKIGRVRRANAFDTRCKLGKLCVELTTAHLG
jgi:hypothetical protein